LVVRPKGAIQEIKGKFIATVEIATKILDEFPAGEVEYPWKTHSVLMSSDANSFYYSPARVAIKFYAFGLFLWEFSPNVLNSPKMLNLINSIMN
jgi:hypothetical protein